MSRVTSWTASTPGKPLDISLKPTMGPFRPEPRPALSIEATSRPNVMSPPTCSKSLNRRPFVVHTYITLNDKPTEARSWPRDWPMDRPDATPEALVEEIHADRVFTLDRRGCSTYRLLGKKPPQGPMKLPKA